MKNVILLTFVALALVVSGCGGGKGGSSKRESNPPPSGTNDNSVSPFKGFNGSLSGKIYYDKNGYKELDLATGQQRLVYSYYLGRGATPSWDGQEFVVGANTSDGSYLDEDIVVFDLNGQEVDRKVINGDVQGIVKISPDRSFFAFDWHKDSDSSGLIVLERNGAFERNFGSVNGRGFDWTSDGKLVFSIGNEIYKVDDIATSEPEKILTLPTDTWQFVMALSVSPDDKKIAFAFESNRDYEGHIFVVGLDGSDLHQVTTSDLWEHSVAWSPDGQYLAVVKGAYLTNVPDSYWSDGGQGNIVPMLYVVKSDARKVDISADDPKDAIVIQAIQDDGTTWYATPDSSIAWRSGN